MAGELHPKPARIGPINEGALLYWPVRRAVQLLILGLMGLLMAIEWSALVLRLE